LSLDSIFKAYDVRGVYPDEIDEQIARKIGNAFAHFTGAQTVVVGRDMRPSSEPLVEAFIEGALLAGADVTDVGLCSTDLVYFASGRLDAPGAMFTASHNPAQYNGIKMCKAGAAPIGEQTGLQQIKEMFAAGVTSRGESAGKLERRNMLDEFGEHVRSFVDVGVLAPLKVVADTANGMGGLVVPAVFDDLPFDLEILYPELDGTFPNHPADPINPANQVDLCKRVVEVGADIGLAFDGDADRVFVVDEQGVGISGSTTTAMVASAVLGKAPGSTILYNLICSKAVPELVTEQGGTPVRTRVGHSFVKAVMAETGAAFGGEHSAHYYFRDNYRADSGLIAAMLVLERLCAGTEPMSVVRRPFDRYADSGEINTQVNDPAGVIDAVAATYAELHPEASQDRLDGLTVDLGDWWFNLRPSNTEPLLRLNLEAATQADCDAHVAEVLAHVTA
jgi:phosphomannomutase